MPRPHFKSLTVRDHVFERIQEYAKSKRRSIPELLEDSLEESEKIRRFAKRIKKKPESIRTYY